MGAGLAVSPDTPGLGGRRPGSTELDVIMIMSVYPGWGGQGFIPEAAPKIAEARAMLATAGRGGLVHVDGGVNSKTAEIVGSHGIDVCIVGSALLSFFFFSLAWPGGLLPDCEVEHLVKELGPAPMVCEGFFRCWGSSMLESDCVLL